MPAKSKPVANMAKNLTKAEREAREQAEAETLPARTRVNLKAPAYVREDKAAAKYWRQTIKRMEGITLLDDLDTEMLAVYCTMLARRDDMSKLCRAVLDESSKDNPEPDTLLESIGKLDSLMTKLQGQEKAVLQYAEKLGLTPSGRVRLARKRAEERAVSDDDDLFGD